MCCLLGGLKLRLLLQLLPCRCRGKGRDLRMEAWECPGIQQRKEKCFTNPVKWSNQITFIRLFQAASLGQIGRILYESNKHSLPIQLKLSLQKLYSKGWMKYKNIFKSACFHADFHRTLDLKQKQEVFTSLQIIPLISTKWNQVPRVNPRCCCTAEQGGNIWHLMLSTQNSSLPVLLISVRCYRCTH